MTDSYTPAAERTLRLIELLLARPEGWTPQELLLELDLSRSSLFVLLRTLKSHGYVEQAGKRGRYLPGPRLLAWRAPQSPTAQDMLTAFYQEIEQLALSSKETLALAVPAGSGCLIVAQAESTQQVRSAYTTGQVYTGLAAPSQVLSLQPPDPVAINGYALSVQGDTIELALPICRDGRTPEAALVLSAPSYRWTAESLQTAFLEELRAAAAHLSYRLGALFYTPYQPRPRGSLRKTTALSPDEITAFLRGPWAASLACIRPDGKPHVIPVWHEWDGRDFYVFAWRGSQWAEYVEQNPNVSLTIDEPWVPLRRVVVQGCISSFDASPADLDQLLERMTRRYLGQANPSGFREQLQRAFRIHPDSIRGWSGLPVSRPASAAGDS